MATHAAQVHRKAEAVKRIEAAMHKLSEVTGVPPITFPSRRRTERPMAEVLEKEALAAYLEKLLNSLRSELDTMTVDALKTYAAARGIDLQGANRKADIIAAIEGAAHG